MEFYRLVAASRQELRAQLRKLPLASFRYSSCYQFAAHWYLLVAADECGASSIANASKHLPIVAAAASPAENLLWEWAGAELRQDLSWLKYEQQAVNNTHGCYLCCDDNKIHRSFLPLSEIMLIVNQTPDSFSDGGRFYQQTDKTLAEIELALQARVDVIDVGAESTRPGAEILTANIEIARLTPLITALAELKTRYAFKISLDSYKAATIEHFLPRLDIVNDVSGRLPDDCLRQIAAAEKSYVFMHSLTIPADPQVTLNPESDPCHEVLEWAIAKRDRLIELGFKAEQLICDPGIGFNKTTSQSWYLLRQIAQFQQLGIELLVGHSRKRFLNKITVNEFAQRDTESAAISVYLSEQSIDYLRIHDYRDYLAQIMARNQLRNNRGRGGKL